MQKIARQVAKFPGVIWVGRRSKEHKISKALKATTVDGSEPSLLRSLFGERFTETGVQDEFSVLLIVLIPQEQRNSFAKTQSGPSRRQKGFPESAAGIVDAWNQELAQIGLSVSAQAASEDKAFIQVSSSRSRKFLTSWLSRRPEVLLVERRNSFAPRNYASKRMLSNGPATTNRQISDSGLVEECTSHRHLIIEFAP